MLSNATYPKHNVFQYCMKLPSRVLCLTRQIQHLLSQMMKAFNWSNTNQLHQSFDNVILTTTITAPGLKHPVQSLPATLPTLVVPTATVSSVVIIIRRPVQHPPRIDLLVMSCVLVNSKPTALNEASSVTGVINMRKTGLSCSVSIPLIRPLIIAHDPTIITIQTKNQTLSKNINVLNFGMDCL